MLAIIIFGAIIFIHELGHYCMGRLCHVGIEEFSIGFGPKLLQWRRKGILYSLRLIFLGGYVRFTGEDAEDDNPLAFNNQPVWKRFLTVLSGPLMNFVLAFLMAMAILLFFGVYQPVPLVHSVIEGTPAEQAGLQAGDRITAVNGTALSYDMDGYEQMRGLISQLGADETIRLTVQRGDESLDIETGLYITEDGGANMGIYVGTARIPMGFLDSVRYSGQVIANVTQTMLDSLRNLVFKGEGADEVVGTVGIVSVMSENISQGVDTTLYLVLIISLNLGIVNLLPLPALDGGRLVLLIVEGIRRKPLPREKEGLIHMIGLCAFFVLFIVVTYKDIMRLITG